MCGRYYRRSDKQRIPEAFRLGKLPEDFVLPPDYNVAPTTMQPVIREARETGERELVWMRWGLIPNFAKTASDFKGLSTINARAENLMDRAMWRVPFERRRCLVPADGYYEWKRVSEKAKEPFAFGMRTGEPFALGGVWDAWKDPGTGEWLQSFSIITTDPNELAARVHNRMPLIVQARDYDRWLSRDREERPPLDLLRAFDAKRMEMHRVDPRVGNARVNEPSLCVEWECPPNSA